MSGASVTNDAAGLAAVPPHRREALARVFQALEQSQRPVLTTHVNADGDGAGCEAALAAWLTSLGKDVRIVNPTPFPQLYRYLLHDAQQVLDPADEQSSAALEAADLFLVVDTGEPNRLGRVAKAFRDRPVIVIDHHPPVEPGFAGAGLRDPTACATGELIYDLLIIAGTADPWPNSTVEGLYAAIVTDTGSFRFSNTTPRAHVVAADLMRRGVDAEGAYRRLFATFPLRRLQLLRVALERLEVDPELPITWITIPASAMQKLGASAEDLEGVVEYARSLEGTELALLFRETANGATKVSFRSSGDVDVNALARQFGGGGHVKAAGALIAGPLEATRSQVLEVARSTLRTLEPPHPRS
ncbi:MAG: bifunctional oligoribonuclease/PAP phosphatase NrnA [Gemmatimonadetes bacterium]|nr:bifunctional oligoribonuclease/PAP phosphatase NrnA [Gemmatimonadota bacterium]